MRYLDLFQRYGHPSKDADVSLRGYFRRPDQLVTATSIKQMDKSAALLIQEAEETIERLRDYRKALADRYSELVIMPYKLTLEIHRHVLYDGHKEYTISIFKTYEDGTRVEELKENYTGKQRREALARFEELKKQRPGIEAVKDIERGRWER